MCKLQRLLIGVAGTVLIACTDPQVESPIYPVGTSDDIYYADQLWQQLSAARLVGSHAKSTEPFVGAAPPHGWVLELLHQNITVGGHAGFVVVKRNYEQKGLTVEQVKADRNKYLSSITVMYQREAGYDTENQNWFWIKYHPDGSLFKKDIRGQMVSLAGRIIKGKTADNNGGCIYCHRSAGGGDYIFYPQVRKP